MWLLWSHLGVIEVTGRCKSVLQPIPRSPLSFGFQLQCFSHVLCDTCGLPAAYLPFALMVKWTPSPCVLHTRACAHARMYTLSHSFTALLSLLPWVQGCNRLFFWLIIMAVKKAHALAASMASCHLSTSDLHLSASVANDQPTDKNCRFQCDCKVWSWGAPREISTEGLVGFQLSPELQKIQNDVLSRLRLVLWWLEIPALCFRNSSAY